SQDLVNWSYVGDVFAQTPSWIAPDGGLWAPDIQYFNEQYYLYYAASDTTVAGGGSAIFVATSSSPVGPWSASSTPVVEPNSGRKTIDPAVIQDDSGQRYIFYGTYGAGLQPELCRPTASARCPRRRLKSPLQIVMRAPT